MPHVNPLCVETTKSADYKPYSNQRKIYENQEKNTHPDNISNIAQDYMDLFSYARKGHMAKYVHMYRPDIYDNISNQDGYYPFKMECDLLAEISEQISANFKDVTEVIEIGPGSPSLIMTKTIPLLRVLERQSSFSAYRTMDLNLEYAKQACQIIKSQFNTIQTEAIKVDFFSRNCFEAIKQNSINDNKKIFIGLGQPIFANNSDEDICKILSNIGMLLSNDDFVLFTVDTNKNEELLEEAYNTKTSYDLLLNTMYYLKNQFNLRDFNPEAFELTYKWNPEVSAVELSLKSTLDQIIIIKKHDYILKKNNEYNILISRKLDEEKVIFFLGSSGLVIKEFIEGNNKEENKFAIIIAQKEPKILKNKE